MLHQPVTATDPRAWLAANRPGLPVLFFAPGLLAARLAEFQTGFPGMVTYAVKANPSPLVLSQLIAGGIRGFDVASTAEMQLVRSLSGDVALHYNNPVRSPDEIAESIHHGITSWSVDDAGELAKLIAAPLPAGAEVAVRLRLPVAGAAYDFGSKFGATPDEAVTLLRQVAAAGLVPAMTFHVGTQCTDPAAWTDYITACAQIAQDAGVVLARLNVGGGFPSSRGGAPIALAPYFAAITGAMRQFETPPALVCEPGRALVADSFAYAVRVKSLRAGRVYLEDGIYGGLSEFPTMGLPDFTAIALDGTLRSGNGESRVVFGPTCDSLDRLPGEVALPAGLAEGDHLLFPSTGAYLEGVSTRFNGYGNWQQVTVERL